jgi:hypothetical protein
MSKPVATFEIRVSNNVDGNGLDLTRSTERLPRACQSARLNSGSFSFALFPFAFKQAICYVPVDRDSTMGQGSHSATRGSVDAHGESDAAGQVLFELRSTMTLADEQSSVRQQHFTVCMAKEIILKIPQNEK